jgi:hypothetical protein
MNLVWEEVYKNNLWNELSNSFLVLSGNYKNVETNIAYHYSINRIEKFQKEIIFTKNFKVNKNFINKIEVDPNEFSPFTLTLVEEEFANGENWESKLHRILNTPGWTFQTLSDWLRVWMDCFKKQISYPGDQIPLDYMIEGKYLDAIPRNLILTENGFQFIDLEWNYKGSTPFKQIMFRAIFTSFFSNHTISKTAMEKVSDYKNWNLIKKVLIDSNYWFHNDDFLNFVDQEMEFQTVISNHFDLIKISQDWLDISSSFRQDYRNYHEKDRVIQSKDMTLEEKDRVIQSKDMTLEEKDRLIKNIYNSSSWKLTKPFRLIKIWNLEILKIITRRSYES